VNVFDGIDTGWCFPVNWTVITLKGYGTDDFPDSAYQYTHWYFSDTVAIFYGRYLKEKPIKITSFFSL
jgi:hypothetical protein